MANLIEILELTEEWDKYKYIYFCGNKTAISDKDLPQNIKKVQVYNNKPISFKSFKQQFPKNKDEEYIKPDITVFYSPSGFETFLSHYNELVSLCFNFLVQIR